MSRSLAAIKTTLYGSGGEDASAEALTQLSQEMCSGQLLQQLIENLGRIDFEASTLLHIIAHAIEIQLFVKYLSAYIVKALAAKMFYPLSLSFS